MGLSGCVNEDSNIQDESKQSSSKWSLHTQTFFGRLSFSRFTLAIQTLTSAGSLGKIKNALSLFFLLLRHTALQFVIVTE